MKDPLVFELRCVSTEIPGTTGGRKLSLLLFFLGTDWMKNNRKRVCYDIMPVRKEEGKSYWKIPFCDDDATREK